MSSETYQSARARLDEILEEVNREDISLDDALGLYEEAVKLSLAACDLSESDLNLAGNAEGEAADNEAADSEAVDNGVSEALGESAADMAGTAEAAVVDAAPSGGEPVSESQPQ